MFEVQCASNVLIIHVSLFKYENCFQDEYDAEMRSFNSSRDPKAQDVLAYGPETAFVERGIKMESFNEQYLMEEESADSIVESPFVAAETVDGTDSSQDSSRFAQW